MADTPSNPDKTDAGESFLHVISGIVKRDSRGKDYIKFSTYLSYLQLTFRVYLPDLGKDRATVLCNFHLKRKDENQDRTERKSKSKT